MKRPDLNHVRELLRAKNYEAVAEIEPQIIQFCKERLSYYANSPERSIVNTFLSTLESLYNQRKKDPNDPLPDYLWGLTNGLMSELGLMIINDHKSLQADDTTLYCWKHKGKWFTNPVIVNKVIEGSKVHIRFTHHEPPHGFEHTFQAKNFKFAIRQLPSFIEKQKALKTYCFFFFNS